MKVRVMIVSTKGKFAAKAVQIRFGKGFPADLVKRTRTMMPYLQIARTPDALRYPPGNHLEALVGERLGRNSVRLNDQWRNCFIWTYVGPKDAEIVDCH